MFTAAVVFGGLVGGFFALVGGARVARVDRMESQRRHLEIDTWLWMLVGGLEILGGVGLFVGLRGSLAPLGVLAAAGLVGLTIGATFYHQRAGDRMVAWLPAVVVGSLAIFYAIARVGSA